MCVSEEVADRKFQAENGEQKMCPRHPVFFCLFCCSYVMGVAKLARGQDFAHVTAFDFS